MSITTAFGSFLKLIRWNNLIILGVSLYLIWWFVYNYDLTFFNPKIVFLILSTLCIAAGGYIINDYYDVKIDAVNKPERMVIDRKIHRMYAIYGHIVLNTMGIGFGFFAHWKIAVIAFLSAFLLWLYSNQLKRMAFIGNFSIAFLTFIAIYQVAIVFGKNPLIIEYAIFAFLISIAREIIKDMEDYIGDEKFGCRTLPIVIGQKKTKQVVYFTTSLLIVLIITLMIMSPQFRYFYIFLTVVPLSIFMMVRLEKASKITQYKRLSDICKLIMVVGLSSISIL